MKLTYKLSQVLYLTDVPQVSEDAAYRSVYRPVFDQADVLKLEARIEAVFTEEVEDARIRR